MKNEVLNIGFTLMVMFSFLPVMAQEPDSIANAFDEEVIPELNIDANLESTSNLWYVGQAADSIEAVTEPDPIIQLFTDEMFMERLTAIPSVIDLSYNTIVRRYIEMYLNKRSDLVEKMLGLSDYYFPIFNDIFDSYGIPTELRYLAVIESALNPRAVSRARAVGIWQFMYGTGRMYGLTINSVIDERRDPVKATHAAARFLSDLYTRYNDWTLAMAAYNCGPGNVNKAIRRSGGKKGYWDIYFYLPRETRGYVPAFVAASYVMNYYHMHNLQTVKANYPEEADTIMLTRRLHLEQLAHVLEMPLQYLRDLNPQYLIDIVPASTTSPQPLKLPAEYALAFIDFQETVYAYKDSVYFNPDRLTATPARYSSSNHNHQPPSGNMTRFSYTVKHGDNLGFIADWYNVRISDIQYWNNIRGNLIRVGQRLVVYVPNSRAERYKTINTMSFAEKQCMVGKSTGTAQSSVAPTSVQAANQSSAYIYYTVRERDTLWEIAKQYPAVSGTDIMKLNNITDASKIRPGQRLKIMAKQ